MDDRNYTSLEKVLIKHGFTEMYGLGLFAQVEGGVSVVTCSGLAKIVPFIDATPDDFIGIYDKGEEDELEKKLAELGLTKG